MLNQSNNVPFPREGTDANLFERLSEYISVFNGNWIRRIEPATQEQINRLKQASVIKEGYKHKLPKSYDVYLKHMGVDDGDLLPLCWREASDIEHMIDFHIRNVNKDDLDAHWFHFAIQDMGGTYAIDLASDIPSVVETEGAYFRRIAESFEKFLFQSAFYEFERYSYYNYFTFSINGVKAATHLFDADDIFDVIISVTRDMAEKHDMYKAWFSDFNNYIVVGEGIAFFISRPYDYPGYGFVTGESAAVVDDILDTLTLKLGFRKKS